MEFLLFSDGACSGNPGPGGWAYLLWNKTTDEVFGESSFQENTTNNQMELLSLTGGLASLKTRHSLAKVSALHLYSDSKYVISGATQWSKSWVKNNWKGATGNEIANQDYWKQLIGVLESFAGIKITWTYVPGHSGICGNEFVDQGAVNAYKTFRERKVLCEGQRSSFAELADLASVTLSADSGAKKKKSKSSSAKALHYLSFVNGKLERHNTWVECESRVKGTAGAKFKKVTHECPESDILKTWGVKP